MIQQIPVGECAPLADEEENDVAEISTDVAYSRLGIVNIIYLGPPDAEDGGWVLVDAGVLGTTNAIIRAAESRFGIDCRPGAIVLTHGHFGHVGALADLAERWDVPIYAHPLEHPYLNGSQQY